MRRGVYANSCYSGYGTTGGILVGALEMTVYFTDNLQGRPHNGDICALKIRANCNFQRTCENVTLSTNQNAFGHLIGLIAQKLT